MTGRLEDTKRRVKKDNLPIMIYIIVNSHIRWGEAFSLCKRRLKKLWAYSERANEVGWFGEKVVKVYMYI